MLFEQLKLSAKESSEIMDAISILYRNNFFAGALDLAVRQAASKYPGESPNAALARAYIVEGYHQALHDMWHFKEKYVDPDIVKEKLVADFGAEKRLVETGVLEEKEIKDARTKFAELTGKL